MSARYVEFGADKPKKKGNEGGGGGYIDMAPIGTTVKKDRATSKPKGTQAEDKYMSLPKDRDTKHKTPANKPTTTGTLGRTTPQNRETHGTHGRNQTKPETRGHTQTHGTQGHTQTHGTRGTQGRTETHGTHGTQGQTHGTQGHTQTHGTHGTQGRTKTRTETGDRSQTKDYSQAGERSQVQSAPKKDRRKIAMLMRRIFNRSPEPELFPRLFAVFLVWFLMFGFSFAFMWLQTDWFKLIKATFSAKTREDPWCYIETQFCQCSTA